MDFSLEFLLLTIPYILFIGFLGLIAFHFFSPKSKIQKKRDEFEEKIEIAKQLTSIYTKHQNNQAKEHPCLINARIHACLSTDKYDYRLIFLLLENNYVNPQLSAKFIVNAWPLLDIKYNEHNAQLKHWFKFENIKSINYGLLFFYTLGGVYLLFLVGGGHQLITGDTFISFILFFVLIFSLIVMAFCLWAGSKLTTILSLERIIKAQNTFINR